MRALGDQRSGFVPLAFCTAKWPCALCLHLCARFSGIRSLKRHNATRPRKCLLLQDRACDPFLSKAPLKAAIYFVCEYASYMPLFQCAPLLKLPPQRLYVRTTLYALHWPISTAHARYTISNDTSPPQRRSHRFYIEVASGRGSKKNWHALLRARCPNIYC